MSKKNKIKKIEINQTSVSFGNLNKVNYNKVIFKENQRDGG